MYIQGPSGSFKLNKKKIKEVNFSTSYLKLILSINSAKVMELSFSLLE